MTKKIGSETSKPRPLQVLIIEDSEDDVLLLIRALERGGYDPVFERVETAGAMQNALQEKPWEVILCDYQLPKFNGLAALSLLKESGIDIPFIIVSGAIGEETAVECMRLGAHDYIMKDNLQRLASAIERELQAAESRRRRKRTEEELAQTLKEWQTTFDATNDAIWILDQDQRVSRSNKTAERFFDRPFGEMIGQHCWKIVHNTEQPIPECPLLRVRKSLHRETMELPVGERWFQVVVDPILDAAGRYSGAVHILSDITERKYAEDALRETEERYRTAIDHSNDGVAMVEGTTLIFVNPKFARIFGYSSPGEIIGQPFLITIHPDDRKRVLEINNLRQQGESVPYRYECKGLRKDGSLVYLEVSAARTTYRQKIVSLAYLRDVTERKLAEAERERFLMAIEQTGEMIVITDPQGAIQYVNPAVETVTGYSRLEILGQNPRFLKSGKQDGDFYRDLWETISSGRAWKGRMVNKRKDGKFFSEEATISPVKDEAGRIVNYVAVKRDISEHLQLTDQFQQAQKMESIGRLAGGVAHDFNNHLTVIIGNAQLALKDLDQGSPLWEMITEIHQAGSKAALLTRKLLAFSRKQVLHSGVVNLNEVVSETEKMLGRLIGEDIELKTVLAPDLGNVEVDAGQMEQVIINLAVNARDAMPRGGRLTIATDNTELDQEEASSHFPVTPGTYVRLSLSDTGEGMSPEVQTHIFEPFYTTKIEGKGTGLGLFTVYGIVKQSRGYIRVDSAVGQGTAVQIYLPRITTEVDKGNEKKRTRGLAGGSETILVVDDDEPLLNLAVKALTRYGYKVLKARDGQEALAMVQEFTGPVHLLLTDMVMPGMNGKELAERLGGLLPGIKVLFMSGYMDEPGANLFLLDNGFIFIQKPFTVEDLARKVGGVLGVK